MSTQILKRTWLSCLVYLTATVSFVTHAATIAKDIQHDLQVSTRHYQAELQKITKEREPLTKKVYALERKLIQLRHQVKRQQQLQDKQQLQLEKLKADVLSWQNQDQFITHLLAAYPSALTNKDEKEQTNPFVQQLIVLQSKLEPSWTPNAKAIAPTGEVMVGQRLDMGPVHWFQNATYSGLLTTEPNQTSTLNFLFDDDMAELIRLHQQGKSSILPFDITLKYVKPIQQDSSWMEHIQQGGVWIIPILGLGCLALLIALVKCYQILRLPKRQSQVIHDLIEQKTTYTAAKSQLKNHQLTLLNMAYQYRHSPQNNIEDLLFHQLVQIKNTMLHYLPFMATTAAVAPLFGLLGTVTGMIDTFKMMSVFGAQDESMLSEGISQALITTELGLIVAIPIMMTHAYLNRKIKAYLTELESDGVLLLQVKWNEPTASSSACSQGECDA